MPRQSAQVILGIYKNNNLRPGQMLMLRRLEHRFIAAWLGTSEEFETGIAYAVEQKWLLVRNNRAFLTPAGFAAM